MKKKLCALLLSASMLSSLAVPAFAVDASETNAPPRQTDGEDVVYLGVENFADSDGDNKDTFKYRFNVNGEEEIYTIAKDEHYSIQNQLMEGYVYDITLDGTEVTSVKLEEGDVAGVLTNVKATSKQIYIDNESFTVNDDAELYDIDAQAGGATVTKITFDELKVDDTVRIVVDSDDHVTKLFRMFIAEDYTAPVSGVPGKLTLKNFLATAMEPVGTSLYVYGGSWDWQDANSSNQSMTIGLPQSWLDFFQSHNADYTYRDDNDPAHSYYWRGYNEYYYGGPDCSGYVGWSVYNLMNTESGSVADGDKGYVMSATSQAKNFAEEQGWGTIDYGEVKKNPDGSIFVEQGDEDTPNKCHRTFQPEDFKTGDIFSMNGHVWICLGKCQDGSLVILHSTPSDSINGKGGGGVQINGVGTSKNCQAVKLAEEYMSKYYPQWWERYHEVYKNFDSYTTVKDSADPKSLDGFNRVGGKFSWTLGNTLTDNEGYAKMSADQILADLFQDVRYIDASANNGGVISPEGRTNLTRGDSVTYSITPFSGYHISDVTVDGQSVGAVDSYTFDNVTDNHTIAVTFARDSGGNSGGGSDHSDPTYAIRASAGKGGSISPKGTVRVEKNDSKTYTITADKGYAIADVTVNGKSVGAVDSYTFKNVTSDQTIRATFSLEGAVEQPGFSDVSKNDWFYDAVQDAVDMGLMAGVSANRFDPNGTVTRAMVAQILYAREGKPAVSGAAAISDVPANAWFHDAMQWAKAQGVIAGYPDGRMEPNAPVTREQLAVILHSYAQKKDMDLSKTAGLAGYADAADVSVWAKDAMSWAVGSGLISGRSASILAPAGSATRAECAVIFTQMFQK